MTLSTGVAAADPTGEQTIVASAERCHGCGSVIHRQRGEVLGRNFCWPTEVDTTQPGYHHLEGQWGYCYTLSRHVDLSEPSWKDTLR